VQNMNSYNNRIISKYQAKQSTKYEPSALK